MSETAVPRVAIAGLGGFAGNHHSVIKSLEEEGLCKLTCTCDPNLEAQQDQIQKFDLIERQVRLHQDFNAMLDEEADNIDVVLLPTPIPLHAYQHQKVVELGKACYLEKPPTLWWPEFQQMLKVEANAKWQTQIGFNFVGDPFRRRLKERLLSGAFGQVQGATLFAIWPRDLAYYKRNNWAGKMEVDGKPVMDSPIGNACAHFVQDLLFLLGSGHVDAVAGVQRVCAKLYRTHPIESFDSIKLEADLGNRKWLRLAVTHTPWNQHEDREIIYCSNAKITFSSWAEASVEYTDGKIEWLESSLKNGPGPLQHNLRTYLEYVQGNRTRATTTLVDSEPFVALHNLAFLSCPNIDNLSDSQPSLKSGPGAYRSFHQQLYAFAYRGTWSDKSAPANWVSKSALADLS